MDRPYHQQNRGKSVRIIMRETLFLSELLILAEVSSSYFLLVLKPQRWQIYGTQINFWVLTTNLNIKITFLFLNEYIHDTFFLISICIFFSVDHFFY